MIKEVLMIRKTVRKIGRQLEKLSDKEVSMIRAFDILARNAKSIEEIVVIEVMREVYQELLDGEMKILAYGESSARSARTPSIALSR